MAKQIIVTQNDYGIELETQFVNDKKKPLDITGYDVKVKIIYNDKTIDIISAGHKDSANGIAYIVLEKEHLINTGLHTSVWSVVDEDEHVTAQENVYYFVKDVEGSEDDTPTTDLPIDADDILDKFNEIDNNLFELTEQGNVVNKEIDSINETLSVVNEQLDNITITMPPPSTIDINTKNLQKILDKAKGKKINLTVQFLAGYYELNSCFIYDNTTIKMTNNTEIKNMPTKFTNPETLTSKNIPILFMNAKPYDNEDSNITGYNGRSNIVIDGGILDTTSAFLLCHGQNIVIKNVTFKNCDSDHYIQIGGCKNVKIQNCKFIGTTERSSTRQYVEFIQIDWMTETGQPYWVSGANIFDRTVNDGIEIDGCEFETGINEYNFMYTCIGSHSSDGDNINKNIIIKNCKFTGYSYRALTIDKMSNVIIDNNIFNDTKSTCAIDITNSNNVTINSNNKIKGGNRGIYCKDSSNIKIDGVLIEEIIADSDFILIGECSNVELNRIKFINCDTNGYNVLIRNCKDINADSCRDINTDTLQGHFFRVYTKNDGVNERITIKNTITDKKEISISSANSIICSKQEELWSGNVTEGEIILNDNISKFKNLKIRIDFYGKIDKNLEFVNDMVTIREFNLKDNTGESLRINFAEIQLTLDSANNKIIINHINQIDINNGVIEDVANNASILKITGERVYY